MTIKQVVRLIVINVFLVIIGYLYLPVFQLFPFDLSGQAGGIVSNIGIPALLLLFFGYVCVSINLFGTRKAEKRVRTVAMVLAVLCTVFVFAGQWVSN